MKNTSEYIIPGNVCVLHIASSSSPSTSSSSPLPSSSSSSSLLCDSRQPHRPYFIVGSVCLYNKSILIICCNNLWCWKPFYFAEHSNSDKTSRRHIDGHLMAVASWIPRSVSGFRNHFIMGNAIFLRNPIYRRQQCWRRCWHWLYRSCRRWHQIENMNGSRAIPSLTLEGHRKSRIWPIQKIFCTEILQKIRLILFSEKKFLGLGALEPDQIKCLEGHDKMDKGNTVSEWKENSDCLNLP